MDYYQVKIRTAVHNDIEEFSDYIFRHSFNREIASKVSSKIYQTIFSLSFMPYRFEEYLEWYRRVILDWKYKIIYRVEEETKKVIIIRIFRTEFEESVI